MSQSYYDATGVLIFSGAPRITPVLKALFAVYALQDDEAGPNAAYIAEIAEETCLGWSAVAEAIAAQKEALGITLPEGADIDDARLWLGALAAKLAPGSQEVQDTIDELDYCSETDLPTLFDLAMHLNDGHNLQAAKLEGAWHASRPRLGEFGGYGQFISREVTQTSSSSRSLSIGEDLQRSLQQRDTVKAAQLIAAECRRLLDGIADLELAKQVSQSVLDVLKTGARI